MWLTFSFLKAVFNNKSTKYTRQGKTLLTSKADCWLMEANRKMRLFLFLLLTSQVKGGDFFFAATFSQHKKGGGSSNDEKFLYCLVLKNKSKLLTSRNKRLFKGEHIFLLPFFCTKLKCLNLNFHQPFLFLKSFVMNVECVYELIYTICPFILCERIPVHTQAHKIPKIPCLALCWNIGSPSLIFFFFGKRENISLHFLLYEHTCIFVS